MALGAKIENISKSFRGSKALNNINLDFLEGQLHGLIGAEGSGKTTIIRLLMGLLKYDEGKIHYTQDGVPVEFSKVRDSIAYMPGSQSLYSDLSIGEHLDFFAKLYGLSKSVYTERRKELLDITRLDKFINRRAGQLSGGMYKKLGLMCALLHSPKALLLDEPTNGVDPISRREFWNLLYRLSEEKIMIVVSTAYMDEAERCAIVHLIDNGTRIGEGNPADLLAEEGVNSFDELFIKKEIKKNSGSTG